MEERYFGIFFIKMNKKLTVSNCKGLFFIKNILRILSNSIINVRVKSIN